MTFSWRSPAAELWDFHNTHSQIKFVLRPGENLQFWKFPLWFICISLAFCLKLKRRNMSTLKHVDKHYMWISHCSCRHGLAAAPAGSYTHGLHHHQGEDSIITLRRREWIALLSNLISLSAKSIRKLKLTTFIFHFTCMLCGRGIENWNLQGFP